MRQMFGDTLYEAFREIKRTFDPLGIFNPGKIVDSPPMTSNLRFGAGYQTPQPDHVFRLFGIRRLRRRGRDVQRRRRVPQETLRDHVPFLHGDARGEQTPPAAAPTLCAWRWRDSSANPGSATRACTKFWTCAWNAAPAKRSVPSASTWRASRANSSRIIGPATERRCGREPWVDIARASVWGSASLPCRTGSRARPPA